MNSVRRRGEDAAEIHVDSVQAGRLHGRPAISVRRVLGREQPDGKRPVEDRDVSVCRADRQVLQRAGEIETERRQCRVHASVGGEHPMAHLEARAALEDVEQVHVVHVAGDDNRERVGDRKRQAAAEVEQLAEVDADRDVQIVERARDVDGTEAVGGKDRSVKSERP